MCRVMGVSRSGFYDSLNRPPSERFRRADRIRESVARVHQETDAIYGATKIAEELKHRDDLETACRNTVAQSMKELGIRSKLSRKAFRPTTTQVDPSKRPAVNILDREFTATAPNQKWVTDITYLATTAGWVYLAAVIDLFSRKVVGWSVSHWPQTWCRRLSGMRLRNGDRMAHNCCITATADASTPARRTSRRCEHLVSPVRCQEPATVTTTPWPNGSSGA